MGDEFPYLPNDSTYDAQPADRDPKTLRQGEQIRWGDTNLIPTLSTGTTTAWDVVGAVPAKDSQQPGSSNKPPADSTIKVSPGAIRDSEQTLMTALKRDAADFNTFKGKVRGYLPWVFYTDSAENATITYHDGTYNSYYDNPPKGEYANFTDEHPQQTLEAVNTTDALVRGIASCYVMVGSFVDLMDLAAQSYAAADRASFPPDWLKEPVENQPAVDPHLTGSTSGALQPSEDLLAQRRMRDGLA
ncbi:hypothetical protein [Dactylosporangium sp. CA-233914]|uniref:hypothetical protein n=1 Tax=Dactylosporangium sp. CA-233914 TaxID=3239934 RepID=UPI003D8DCCF0